MNILQLIVVVMVLYLGGMLAVGFYGKKYANSFEDYLTAAKQGTFLMVCGSYIGSHIGNGIVVGGAEYGAIYGIGGIWYGVGSALGYVSFCFCFIKETLPFGTTDNVGYFKSPVRSQNHRYNFCSVQCFGGYEYYGRTDYCGKEPVLLFRNECNAGGGGCMYYRFYLFNDVGPVGRFDDRHDSGCRDFLLYGDSLRMHVVTGRIGPDERSPSKLFL